MKQLHPWQLRSPGSWQGCSPAVELVGGKVSSSRAAWPLLARTARAASMVRGPAIPPSRRVSCSKHSARL